MTPDSGITVNDAGHDYDLHNVGEGVQNIQFIKKEPVEEGSTELKVVHDGTTTEAILQVAQHRLEVLYARVPDQFTRTAISHIGSALGELLSCNADRKGRGVEGSNVA